MSMKTTEVTAALQFFVEVMLAFTLDEQGYVIFKKTGERYLYGPEGGKKPIIAYQDPIPDREALLLNPFAEGATAAPSSVWFYSGLRMGLIARIRACVEEVLRAGLADKAAAGKKGDERPHHPSAILNVLALKIDSKPKAPSVADSVDEQMLKEIETIFDRHEKDLFYVFYDHRQFSSAFRCPLFDEPKWVEDNLRPEPRKKTLDALKTILRGLFKLPPGSDDLAGFTAKGRKDAPPKMSSWLECIFNVYNRCNDVLEAVDEKMMIDLGTFWQHLELMPGYTRLAKFATPLATAAASKPAVPAAAPGAVPTLGGVVPTLGATPTPATPAAGQVPPGYSLVPTPTGAVLVPSGGMVMGMAPMVGPAGVPTIPPAMPGMMGGTTLFPTFTQQQPISAMGVQPGGYFQPAGALQGTGPIPGILPVGQSFFPGMPTGIMR